MSAVNTREVAHEAREFARQNGVEVGTRGRLSADAFVTYLVRQPKRAREIAANLGVDVSKRGRLSPTDAEKIAALIR